jgi:hypothetical protein
VKSLVNPKPCAIIPPPGEICGLDEVSARAPGDYVDLRALMDAILLCSACPSLVDHISGDRRRSGATDLLQD